MAGRPRGCHCFDPESQPVTAAQPGPGAPWGWLVALPSLPAPGDVHHTEKSSTWAGHPAGRLLAGALPLAKAFACSDSLAEISLSVFVKYLLQTQDVQPAALGTPWERSYTTFLIPGLPWAQILQPPDPCCSHTAHSPASSLMLINDCCVSY